MCSFDNIFAYVYKIISIFFIINHTTIVIRVAYILTYAQVLIPLHAAIIIVVIVCSVWRCRQYVAAFVCDFQSGVQYEFMSIDISDNACKTNSNNSNNNTNNPNNNNRRIVKIMQWGK